MANVYISGLTSGQYIAWSGGTKIVNNGDGGAIISNNAGTAKLTLDSSGNCTLAGAIDFAGASIYTTNSGHVRLGTGSYISWTSIANGNTGTRDLYLQRDAAGILAQRNSTNAQAFRVYNTYSGSVDEWFSIDWKTTSNTCILSAKKSGSGVQRQIVVGAVTAGITASTTQTQGQGPLTTELNEVSTVANANDTVTLPTAVAGLRITVINNGANTLKIYPASGDNLGAGVDTSTTLATSTVRTYIAYDATNWRTE